jgi:phospholipid/cholesterol/gamma-HCH transport system ATP-binding protein
MSRQRQHDFSNEPVVVSVDGLYKSFYDNHVLRGITLEVHKGENVIVLGRSGSGKSVLIRTIAGLFKQDEGTVNVLGHDVNKLSKKELYELRQHMGFLFQQSALYDSLTVRENLEFSLVRNNRGLTRKQVNDAVAQALDEVGLPETEHQLPSELSGGQQKRIGIARMLILRPQIILYDEPTAGLDPITCIEINNLILKVKERYKASSLLITHDLTCARHTGDRILMIVDGKFVREGSFEHVFDTAEADIKGFYDYNFITDP